MNMSHCKIILINCQDLLKISNTRNLAVLQPYLKKNLYVSNWYFNKCLWQICKSITGWSFPPLAKKSTVPIELGKPKPFCRGLPLVWIMSTNKASLFPSFLWVLLDSKAGPAGSNPILKNYLFIRLFLLNWSHYRTCDPCYGAIDGCASNSCYVSSKTESNQVKLV